MIVSFAKDLFNIDEDNTQQNLADILGLILEEKCFVSIASIYETFYNDESLFDFEKSPFAQNYLSKRNVLNLECSMEVIVRQGGYLNADQITHFNHITIGFEQGNIEPHIALKLLQEPSKVILENGTNDWHFINGLIIKYSKYKKRKSIYKYLLKAVENKWIISENAGGKGQIIPRIRDLRLNRYEFIFGYKLMVLMDSDRNKPDDLHADSKKIIEYLKNSLIPPALAQWENTDLVVWHILYKREIENYVPLEVLQENLGDDIEFLKLDKKVDTELDFIKYSNVLPKVAVKSIFPPLFLTEFTRDKLEFRCKHHPVAIELPNGTFEEVSEIEQILLKIAKIV